MLREEQNAESRGAGSRSAEAARARLEALRQARGIAPADDTETDDTETDDTEAGDV